MSEPTVEQVYKLSGVPTYTLVKPTFYGKLLVSLRTPGRGLVVEGPSGIGKTTAIRSAIKELEGGETVRVLSARNPDHVPEIRSTIGGRNLGLVVVDDFHKLPEDIRSGIADFLKELADTERQDTKMVVIGINKTGKALVQFAEDLNTRIDVIRFESNPDFLVEQVITQGERPLNITIPFKAEIVAAAAGSFFLAQLLCQEACIAAGVLAKKATHVELRTSFDNVNQKVFEVQARRFMDLTTGFAKGYKLKREGRAPYLHILKWLSESEEWSVNLDDEARIHQELRGSVTQVVEKGYLDELVSGTDEFQKVLHYDPSNKTLTVEDPQFIFFLRNMNWNNFAKRVGFSDIHFDSKYDFALSFAGPERPIAAQLAQLLQENEIHVFYDKDEAHRILAADVEEYLGPIYRSEASFVVCILGPEYPKRVWTRIESAQFAERFGQDAVIPVWYEDLNLGPFDETPKKGGYILKRNVPLQVQVEELATMLMKKIGEFRQMRARPA